MKSPLFQASHIKMRCEENLKRGFVHDLRVRTHLVVINAACYLIQNRKRGFLHDLRVCMYLVVINAVCYLIHSLSFLMTHVLQILYTDDAYDRFVCIRWLLVRLLS